MIMRHSYFGTSQQSDMVDDGGRCLGGVDNFGGRSVFVFPAQIIVHRQVTFSLIPTTKIINATKAPTSVCYVLGGTDDYAPFIFRHESTERHGR
jgi:hypothetical protein